MDEVRLVAEIRKRPLIWEHQGMHYPYKRSVCWKEVSESLGYHVTTCKARWKLLRYAYSSARRKINLAKKMGNYDPKHDYSPRLHSYEDFTFLENDASLRQRKQNEINTFSFISEVQKRPDLWGSYYWEGSNARKRVLWKEVAQIMEMDVIYCISKWRNLKMKFRKTEKAYARMAREKLNGTFDTNFNNYHKFTYFDALTFLSNCKISTENQNSNSNDYDNESNIERIYNKNSQEVSKITGESSDDDRQVDHDSSDDNMLFEESGNIVNRQLVGHVMSPLPISNSLEQNSAHEFYANGSSQSYKIDNIDIKEEPVENEEKNYPKTLNDICDPDCNFLISFLSHMRSMSQIQNIKYRAKMTDVMLSLLTAKAIRESRFTNALKEPMENKIIGAFDDLEDPDCNFLVSFLPQLKSLTQLEKLKFRAKMSNLMLEISFT